MNRRTFLSRFLRGRRAMLAVMAISAVAAVLLSLVTPLVFRFFIDDVINQQPSESALSSFLLRTFGGSSWLRSNLWAGALAILVLYALQSLFLFLRGDTAGKVSEGMARDIRDSLFAHLQRLPHSYQNRANTGDLVQRCTSDVEQIRKVMGTQLPQMIRSVATIAIACAVLFSLNSQLAWRSFLLMPVLILYAFWFFEKNQKAFLASDESEGRLTSVVQEDLSGIRVIKAFGREAHERDRFAAANEDYRQITFRMIKLIGYYWSSSDLLCMAQTLIVLFSGIAMARSGEITIGTFFVFITYESNILWPIRQLGRILADIGKSGVSMDRLNEIFNEREEDLSSGITPPLKGDIRFDHVSFRYADAAENVLHDLTLEIPAGTTAAIVGPTGSGKSSLVQLLTRLEDYTEGSITMDGYELKQIQKEYLRRQVGIVLQEPFLFSRTIYENIHLANEKATRQEVYEAASAASIHNGILEFDKGYDTLVGEKGVTLSGGQKQRIAIARTLLNKSRVLIFDDSLSAVDTQTDLEIRSSLKKIKGQATTIIITQRVASARDADCIYVLENGRITASGTHAQLIRQPGLYQRINEIQSNYLEGGEAA